MMLEPSRVTASNSRFVPALVRLAREGQLIKTTGIATGAWAYNSQISYWARPGTPKTNLMTWEQFCDAEGRSPAWTSDDVARAVGLAS